MTGPCLCGADDCPACHPENGRYVGRRWLYDDGEGDFEQALEDAEEALIEKAQRRLDALADHFRSVAERGETDNKQQPGDGREGET